LHRKKWSLRGGERQVLFHSDDDFVLRKKGFYMPLFALTESLRGEINKVIDKAPLVRVAMYKTALLTNEVSLDAVIALKHDLKEEKGVNELLQGADLIVPVQQKRKMQSPKTKAKFDQYRRELENKQYLNMVKNVTQPLEQDAHRDRREIKAFKDQMGIGREREIILIIGFAQKFLL
jgi:hypothetical protein